MGERSKQLITAGVELLRAHVLGTDTVQGGELSKGRPLRPDPDVVGTEHARNLCEAGAQCRVVPSSDGTQAKVCPRQVLGAHPHSCGDHQPAHEATMMVAQPQLLGDRCGGERCWGRVSGAEAPGAADHRGPWGQPGRNEVVGEDGHQVLCLGAQCEAGVHSCTDWASMASAARRYSPESQSLARCR